MSTSTIDIACPHCRRVSRLGATFRGQGRCPGCRRRVEIKDAATPEAPPVALLLDPPPPVEVQDVKPPLRCAFCHDALGADAQQSCAKCGTALHRACWSGISTCPTCGCGAAPPDAPVLEDLDHALVVPASAAIGVDPPPAQVADAAAVVAPADPTTRPCPRCGGAIKHAAKKCRHCGDFLDGPPVDLAATRRCPLCGEQIRAAAKKCRHCGEFLDPKVQRGRRQGELRFALASPGARLLAYIVDNWLLTAPTWVLMIVAMNLLDSRRTKPEGWACLIVSGLLFMALCIYQWRRLVTVGATLGKGWLGLQVVRFDGTPVDFSHGVVMRNWVMNVLGNLYIFGCMFRLVDGLMIFGADRRTLHDHIAGTIVIEAGSLVRGKGDA